MSALEMVINLHVTERCNFRCSYCFGKWGLREEGSPELSAFADSLAASALMRDVKTAVAPGRAVRFNFVGGEPALLPNIAELIEMARRLGARTSYVTNGLMLRRFDAEWTSSHVDIVGISVDSTSAETNRAIGRVGGNRHVIDYRELAEATGRLRAARGRLVPPAVKINTVVSRFNFDEDLTDIIRTIAPSRWKVLKMLPVYSSGDGISKSDYRKFIDRHKQLKMIMTTEDNDQMTGSYVMIDPRGRFFWFGGKPGEGYTYSDPIIDVGAEIAWSQTSFDAAKFRTRYSTPEMEYP